MGTTTGRVVRRALTLGVVAMLAVPVLADGAYAKGKPSKVTLTCDVGASASGTVQLQASIFGGPASNQVPVSCSSGQTFTVSIHPTAQPAAAYSYDLSVTNPAGTGGCQGSGTRGGAPVTCTPFGASGTTLTVT
ncbi:MAG: hypothetical protein JWP02_3480, partial [Acidimicrobiales bacterium]|nr:hypothetical protein [Acidimicrobiales bacterium]